MPFNGSGVWSRLYNWANDAANGIKIRADRMDAEMNDMVSNGFDNTLTRDGQGVPTANLPMAGFKHTGAGDATASGQYLVYGQTAAKVAQLWQSSRNAFTKFTLSSPIGTNSGTSVMMGLGSTWTLTPTFSGRVRVDVRGFFINPAAGVSSVDISNGTGSAPANGAAVSGAAGVAQNAQVSSSGGDIPFSLLVELSGLTLSTAYWFDLNLSSSSGTALVKVASVVIEEF